MIQEELGEKRKVFAVHWIFETINFKHCYLFFRISVDLISRWMEEGALFRVPEKLIFEWIKA